MSFDIHTLRSVALLCERMKFTNIRNKREEAYNKGLDDVAVACAIAVKRIQAKRRKPRKEISNE